MDKKERTDNNAHIFGLGDSMNHRRGTDDKYVEFEVSMEQRQACPAHYRQLETQDQS